jgi:hypothetical protein
MMQREFGKQNLKHLFLFQPLDFAWCAREYFGVSTQLKAHHEMLRLDEGFLSKSPQVRQMLPVVHDYLTKLTIAVDLRQAMMAKLAGKASGKSYGFFENHRNGRRCDEADTAYIQVGQKLSQFMREL